MNVSTTEERILQLEISVQEIRFTHAAKVDAVTSGVSIIYGQLQQLQQEVTGFRAEASAHLETLTTDVASLTTSVASLTTGVASLKVGQSKLEDGQKEILRLLRDP